MSQTNTFTIQILSEDPGFTFGCKRVVQCTIQDLDSLIALILGLPTPGQHRVEVPLQPVKTKPMRIPPAGDRPRWYGKKMHSLTDYSFEEVQDMATMRRQGRPYKSIQRKYGASETLVRSLFCFHQIKDVPRQIRRKGSLPAAQIAQFYLAGAPVSDLAQRFGVTKEAIRVICVEEGVWDFKGTRVEIGSPASNGSIA